MSPPRLYMGRLGSFCWSLLCGKVLSVSVAKGTQFLPDSQRTAFEGQPLGRHMQPTARDYYSLRTTEAAARERYTWWADDQRQVCFSLMLLRNWFVVICEAGRDHPAVGSSVKHMFQREHESLTLPLPIPPHHYHQKPTSARASLTEHDYEKRSLLHFHLIRSNMMDIWHMGLMLTNGLVRG